MRPLREFSAAARSAVRVVLTDIDDTLSLDGRLPEEVFGLDAVEANEQIVFVGDSPNDESMFAFFRHAVAFANFAPFAHRVRHKPHWLTTGERGAGFAELADALLAAHSDC